MRHVGVQMGTPRWAGVLAVLLVGTSLSPVARAASSPVGFLAELAAEYAKAGREDDAMHELRKLLLLDPDHEPARRELSRLESVLARRTDAAIERARAERERLVADALAEAQARARRREQAIEEALGQAQTQAPPLPVLPRAQEVPLTLPRPPVSPP